MNVDPRIPGTERVGFHRPSHLRDGARRLSPPRPTGQGRETPGSLVCQTYVRVLELQWGSPYGASRIVPMAGIVPEKTA